MATNPYVNKVGLADGTTIIDITDTTAVADAVDSSAYFYSASGQKLRGSGRTNLWKNGDIEITSSSGVSDNDIVQPLPAGTYSVFLTNQTTWTGTSVYVSFHSIRKSDGNLTTNNRVGAHSFYANTTDRQIVTLTGTAKGIRLEAANNATNSSGKTATYSQIFIVPEPLTALETVTGVTPTESSQDIAPSTGYIGLASVQIDAIPTNYIGSAVKIRQAYIGYDSLSVSAYTSTDVMLTVSRSGTYKVSWIGWRNTTGGTSGSQLCINGTAYGTANTTFGEGGNYGQMNVLTGVSLKKNDVISVLARSRNTSYIMAVGNLIIEEEKT